MKRNVLKTISRANVNRAVPYRVLTTTSVVMCALLVSAYSAHAATLNQTLCLRTVNKTMSDGAPVTFWGYTAVPAPTLAKPAPTCSDAGVGLIPGPDVVVGIGDTLNLTLSLPMGASMPPMEPAPYMGHTIHMHGADVPTIDDGVPETSTAVGGMMTTNPSSYIYHWTPTPEMGGTYMYHCHVHTVKHLEMGMYGSLIVRPKDAQGNYLNQLTPAAVTSYDYIQTYLLSSVDPAYHTATGDSPVFADYNPKYFLLNGKENGKDARGNVTPAETLPVATNSKVALRLIGLHSVNGTFSIRDGAGVAKPFTVYVEDGRQYPTAETVTSLDVGPGQRFDIIFTTPSTSGTWSPQFEYQKLRGISPNVRAPYATVFGQVTF